MSNNINNNIIQQRLPYHQKRKFLYSQVIWGESRRYTQTRNIVKALGEGIHVPLKPHDLRKRSATYGSRNGVPLEIISKLILWHKKLTDNSHLPGQGQRYRGHPLAGCAVWEVRILT